jgi:ferritin-like metal-binding protein YciE
MSLGSIHDLLIHQLRDLYSAERQILLVWPQLIDRSASQALRTALAGHRDETARHVVRLEEAFWLLETVPHGVRCRGMEGLLMEALSNASAQSDPALRDSGIISDCQRVEGYELAVYGTARIFAESLGHHRIVAMLERTLEEEEAIDAVLSGIAEREVGPAALRAASREARHPELVRSISAPRRQLRITV